MVRREASVLGLLGMIACANAGRADETHFRPPTWYDPNDAAEYEVAAAEDNEIKALTRPLSSYRPGELRSLPMVRRRVYRIVLSPDLTREQAKATLVKAVADAVGRNADLDVITVFAYDRKAETEGAYTVGRLVWAPGGRPGNVTPHIAANNDRSRYEFKVDFKATVGSSEKRPQQEDFRIYDAVEEALWANPEEPEDRAIERVAKRLGMTPEAVAERHLKVLIYRVQ